LGRLRRACAALPRAAAAVAPAAPRGASRGARAARRTPRRRACRATGAAVAERLGPDGRHAWSLARGEERGRVHARRPPTDILERLEFPEPVGNELTLRRALGALLDRVLARPERGSREIRKIALAARLVGGGSWRRTLTLRDSNAERSRL